MSNPIKSILVAYATREGHTQKVAEHIKDWCEKHGVEATLVNVRNEQPQQDVSKYDCAILASSVHYDVHAPEIIQFAKKEHKQLNTMLSAFLSISMTAHGAVTAGPKQEKQVKMMESMIQDVFRKSGWKTEHYSGVAGALVWSKYGRLKKMLMKYKAGKFGTKLDAKSKDDTVYTDWAKLDQFLENFIPLQ
eukprot:m.36998 g.36998  ORF g.36998 m.36998 type:complete len:191 (+) comp9223_c0_seq1:245-817(+)